MKAKQEPLIKALDLAAGYKGKTVWKNASFSVEPGEFIGMLGPNGAGKSTLMNLILGLIKPTYGQIEVLGSSPRKGNSLIGYVPQRRNLDFDSRIQAVEYVKLNVSPNNWGFSLPNQARAERAAAMEALKLVDGQDLAEKALYELSGGEAQRVFLAQALVGKPKLLLLDEPLANLDIKRGNQLIRLIRGVARQNNIAVILIAHDINPLLSVADRIIYIANGKVASGELTSIITSKSLSKLYNAPIEVLKDSKGRLAVLGVEEAMHHDH
jgi:zinc/manganese transport system ATP-binding protein